VWVSEHLQSNSRGRYGRAEELTVAIAFSGEFTSPRSPDEVYDFLCDPNKFGPLLPEFRSMTVQDATHFTVTVGIGVGNIRGSAEIKMELAESVRPARAQYKGRGTAVGSQITIGAGFDLSPVDGSTRVAWQAEAGVFGKLASLAGGMLEALGKKNIQKLIDGLQWALTMPAAKPVAEEATTEEAQAAPAEQPAQAIPQQVPGPEPQTAPAEQAPQPAADSAVHALDDSRVSGAVDGKF
jgi:carbon monoxide dehydrogenase subunit G